jgi:hypothetical protein
MPPDITAAEDQHVTGQQDLRCHSLFGMNVALSAVGGFWGLQIELRAFLDLLFAKKPLNFRGCWFISEGLGSSFLQAKQFDINGSSFALDGRWLKLNDSSFAFVLEAFGAHRARRPRSACRFEVTEGDLLVDGFLDWQQKDDFSVDMTSKVNLGSEQVHRINDVIRCRGGSISEAFIRGRTVSGGVKGRAVFAKSFWDTQDRVCMPRSIEWIECESSRRFDRPSRTLTFESGSGLRRIGQLCGCYLYL